MYTYEYDSNYLPGMPVADILIGQPSAKPALPLVAIVDSGSDGTSIPLQVLQRLNLRVKRRVYMHGVAGGVARVALYVVSLRIAGRTFDQVDVAGDATSTEVLLGRNVLNQFVIVLDGLASAVEIHD